MFLDSLVRYRRVRRRLGGRPQDGLLRVEYSRSRMGKRVHEHISGLGFPVGYLEVNTES